MANNGIVLNDMKFLFQLSLKVLSPIALVVSTGQSAHANTVCRARTFWGKCVLHETYSTLPIVSTSDSQSSAQSKPNSTHRLTKEQLSQLGNIESGDGGLALEEYIAKPSQKTGSF